MFGVAVAYLVALPTLVRATPLAMPLGVDVALAAAAAVPLALVDDGVHRSMYAQGRRGGSGRRRPGNSWRGSLAAIALYGVMRQKMNLNWDGRRAVRLIGRDPTPSPTSARR